MQSSQLLPLGSLFWDGRAKDLGEQAKGPIQNSVEMHSTPQLVEQTLGSIPEYVDAFRKAFPKAGKPVSFDNWPSRPTRRPW